MAGAVQIKVGRTGRFRPPKLDNGELTFIGNQMVEAQLKRWAEGIDADGNFARPLSKKYFFQKRRFRGIDTAIRDNYMTGALVKNFTLRKAIDGVIRAEPTQRITRQHAVKAQQYAQMIGFSPSDIDVVFRAAASQYAKYASSAWQETTGSD
jgi:hypothetical protein